MWAKIDHQQLLNGDLRPAVNQSQIRKSQNDVWTYNITSIHSHAKKLYLYMFDIAVSAFS